MNIKKDKIELKIERPDLGRDPYPHDIYQPTLIIDGVRLVSDNMEPCTTKEEAKKITRRIARALGVHTRR